MRDLINKLDARQKARLLVCTMLGGFLFGLWYGVFIMGVR